MDVSKFWIWHNGRIVPYKEVKFGVLTHALQYGTGVFEGVRAYWNTTQNQLYGFRLKDHFERFIQNLKILGLESRYSADEFCEATLKVLRKNEFRGDCYIRPWVGIANEAIGVFPTSPQFVYVISAIPFEKYLEDAEKGISLKVSWWRRVSSLSIPPRGKISGAYVNSYLAASEARRHGAGEGLLLTQQGFVSECSGENIFLVKKQGAGLRKWRLITPDESQDILVGITRDTTMRLAKMLWNCEVIERQVSSAELFSADEIFLTGTASEIAPVTEIDGRKVGNGEVGELTRRLRSAYLKTVRNMSLAKEYEGGLDPRWIDNAVKPWLTPVYQQ